MRLIGLAATNSPDGARFSGFQIRQPRRAHPAGRVVGVLMTRSDDVRPPPLSPEATCEAGAIRGPMPRPQARQRRPLRGDGGPARSEFPARSGAACAARPGNSGEPGNLANLTLWQASAPDAPGSPDPPDSPQPATSTRE